MKIKELDKTFYQEQQGEVIFVVCKMKYTVTECDWNIVPQVETCAAVFNPNEDQGDFDYNLGCQIAFAKTQLKIYKKLRKKVNKRLEELYKQASIYETFIDKSDETIDSILEYLQDF